MIAEIQKRYTTTVGMEPPLGQWSRRPDLKDYKDCAEAIAAWIRGMNDKEWTHHRDQGFVIYDGGFGVITYSGGELNRDRKLNPQEHEYICAAIRSAIAARTGSST